MRNLGGIPGISEFLNNTAVDLILETCRGILRNFEEFSEFSEFQNFEIFGIF